MSALSLACTVPSTLTYRVFISKTKPESSGRRYVRPHCVGSDGASGAQDAGDAFVQRFRSLSVEVLGSAQPLSAGSASGGCCGGNAAATSAEAAHQSTGGCCGGGGASSSASGQAPTAAVSQHLNSMMAGLEGALTREDMQEAFYASRGAASGAGSGERFLDVAAILRGEGGEEDEDADLNALVV